MAVRTKGIPGCSSPNRKMWFIDEKLLNTYKQFRNGYKQSGVNDIFAEAAKIPMCAETQSTYN